MTLKFKKPWVQYTEPKAGRFGKSMTVPGQSMPMSKLIQRYMTGQIFGLSQNQVFFDAESDDIDTYQGRFIPDPGDFCAPERAALEMKTIKTKVQKFKDEKIKVNVEDGFRGEGSTESIQLSPEK